MDAKSKLSKFAFEKKKAFGEDSASKKDLNLPFALRGSDVPYLKSLQEMFPNSNETLNVMFSGPWAQNTQKQYATIVKKFESFCVSNKFDFPVFNEFSVIAFIHQSIEAKETFSFFDTLLPALSAVERTQGVRSSSLTAYVRDILNTVRRKIAPQKPPVKKAENLTLETVAELIKKEIYEKDKKDWDRMHFRTLFRMVIIYATMCRFNDFCLLKTSHFKFFEDHLIVYFPGAKNDQLFQGNETVIPKLEDAEFCPFSFIKLFFETFKLFRRDILVNFKLRKNSWVPVSDGKCFSYSAAVKSARFLLRQHDVNVHYTEKSCKTAAVSASFRNGLDAEKVMLHGRWRSVHTPFHYHNADLEFKKNVARKVFGAENVL